MLPFTPFPYECVFKSLRFCTVPTDSFFASVSSFFFFSVCMVSVYSDCCLKVSVKFPYSCRSHGIVVLLRFVFKFAFSNVHTDCCLKVSEFTLFTRILLLHFFKVCVFNVHTDCCLIVSVSILFTRIRFLLHFFLSLCFQCSHWLHSHCSHDSFATDLHYFFHLGTFQLLLCEDIISSQVCEVTFQLIQIWSNETNVFKWEQKKKLPSVISNIILESCLATGGSEH